MLVHRGSRGHSFVYELLWQGEGATGDPFLMGLIEVEKLNKAQSLTPSNEPLTPRGETFDPPLTPHCSPFDPPLTPDANAAAKEDDPNFEPSPPKNAHQAVKENAGVVPREPS